MKTTTCILILFLFPLLTLAQQKPGKNVVINGKALSAETIQGLETAYNIQVVEGKYWYDPKSGLWGVEGRPTQGIIMAGLDLGGSLKPYASGGTSQVFINGRQLTRYELTELIKLTGTYIPEGHYWMDANGYAGPNGQPAAVNLFHLAAQYYGQNSNGSGSSFYRNSYTGIGSGSSGGSFYVIGKDFSYSN